MRLISALFKPRNGTVLTGGREVLVFPIEFDSAQLVKKNRQRTVHRIEQNGRRYYVKTCRIDGLRAWLRDLFRGPKAKLEFENARTLLARGISAVEPVTWSGKAWPGESTIVTRDVANAVPLADYLTQQFPTLPSDEQRTIRRMLARSLGGYLASLYAAGAIHPDPHPGNLLVSFDGHGEVSFTLLDVHSVRFSSRITPNELVKNLVLFNRWFILRTSRTDRMRFWKTFRMALGRLKREDGRTVELQTVQSNLRFWANRFGRYSGENREFRRIRSGPFHGFAARDGILDSILDDPDAIFDRNDIAVLKSSRSSQVVSFCLETTDGTRRLVMKRVPARSWFASIKHLFRISSVYRSWQYGLSLRDRFLPTPRPLMAFHRYRYGFPFEGYFLSEEQCCSMTLDRAVNLLATLHDQNRTLHSWTERLGRLVRIMHDRGIKHGDLKAANILLTLDKANPMGAEMTFIDLVGTKSSRSISRKNRIEDIARVAASFMNSKIVTNRVRWRFLSAYCGVFPHFPLSWSEIRSALVLKRQRNEMRGRTLE